MTSQPPGERASRVASTDGLELAVFERGDGAHPTIVLVHGYPDTSAVWDPIADDLATDFHVVTYDVRGAGASGIPASTAGYELPHLVADLEAVIRATSPDAPVHVVGHDWGSIQSWEAVTTLEPAHGDRAGIIASFTTISGPSLDHVGAWMRSHVGVHPGRLLDALRQGRRSWYVYAFHAPLLAPLTWRLGLARAWRRLVEAGEGAPTDDRWPAPTLADDAARGVNLYRANVRPRLSKPHDRRTEVPVQLIVPQHDRFVTTALLDGTIQWAPNLFQRDVAGGHWIVRTKPARVASWVRELVQHVEGAPASASLERAARRARRSTTPAAASSFDGSIVVVTGAGSGIGRETALAFATRGAIVAVADIDLDAASRTVELCTALGATAHAYRVDVGDTDAMEAFAKTVEADLGVPDVVVNNAGIGMAGAMLDTTVADWERVLDVNLWGVIHGSRLFGRMMADRGEGGHIVNTASAAAFMASRTLPAYATSKAAVLMLSACLRAELAADGIGVSAICPGIVDTGITSTTRFVGVSDEEQRRRQTASKRLYQRRNFTPDRVAEAIVHAVECNEAVVPVAVEAKAMQLGSRFTPGLMRKLAQIDAAP